MATFHGAQLAASSVPLGGRQNFVVSFANTGGVTGYRPFIALDIPPGVTYVPDSATYLDSAVTETFGTFDANGTAVIRLAHDSVNGGTITVVGQPGDRVVILEPPFGSFVVGQTRVDIAISLEINNDPSVLGQNQQVTAVAGFAYGDQASGAAQQTQPAAVLPDVGSDPAGAGAILSLSPSIFQVSAGYTEGLGDIEPTGSSWPATWTVGASGANGYAIDNFVIVAPLPDGMRVKSITVNNGAHNWNFNFDPKTNILSRDGTNTGSDEPVIVSIAQSSGNWIWYDPAQNQIEVGLLRVSGSGNEGASDAWVSTQFYIDKWQSLGQVYENGGTVSGDLVLTDNVPYQGSVTGFTLTDKNGLATLFAVDFNGIVSVVGGNADNWTAATYDDVTTGAFSYYADIANGQIIANFGAVGGGGGQASIVAQFTGGQAQLSGLVVKSDFASGHGQLVDQLQGGAGLTGFTLHEDGTTYSFAVDSGGTISETYGGGWGLSAGGDNSNWVTFDNRLNRITANWGAVTNGTTYSIDASHNMVATGLSMMGSAASNDGEILSQITPRNVRLTGTAAATGTISGIGVVSEVSSVGSFDVGPISLQKGVYDSTAGGNSSFVKPGDHLIWTVTGEVSNFYDVGNLVLHDTLGDGQTWDGGTITVHAVQSGSSHDFTLGAAFIHGGTKAIDGTTALTLDLSAALVAEGLDSDFNGGQAPNDVPGAATPSWFTFQIGSTIDTNWTGIQGLPPVYEGDGISNDATINGNIYTGKDFPGSSFTGAAVADSAGAEIVLPTGHLQKSIFAVVHDGTLEYQYSAGDPTFLARIDVGDLVTYRLVYTLPITDAKNVQLLDFLPLPVFQASDPDATGGGSWSFAGGTVSLANPVSLPGAGQIQYDSGNTAPTPASPVLRTDTGSNAVIINFSDIIQSPAYPTTAIDLLLTVRVQDAEFADGLSLTNLASSTQANTPGDVFGHSALVRFTMAAPVLDIETGVVAVYDLNGSGNEQGVIDSGTGQGGVSWSLPGTTESEAVFSGGTINSTSLLSNAVHGTLSNVGAGAVFTYAVVVENTGSSMDGAFHVVVRDVLPTDMLATGVGVEGINLHVTDGAGHAIAYTDTLANGTLVVTLTDPGIYQGSLTKSNANDGKNIAVITFDMVLPYDGSAKSAVAVPEFIQTNAVEIVNYSSSNENKLNRALANPASASTTVTTAAAVFTKQVVSTSEDPTGADSGALKIGESVTYEVTVVMPGGTLGSVDIADVLPSGLSYVANSASITAQGSAVTATPTLTVNDGTIDFNLGNVTVGNDLRNATDTFTFRLTGVVTAAAGVSDGQTLDNVATISFVDPNNIALRTSVTADAAVVMAVPSLSFTDEVENLSSESPSFGSSVTVNAGDTIEYRLHLTNTGTGSAFQVELKDLLNELGLDQLRGINAVIIANSITKSDPDAVVQAVWTPVLGGEGSVAGVDVQLGTLAAGGTLDVTFKAVVSADAIWQTNFSDAATYTADTLPSSDPNHEIDGDNLALSGTASAGVLTSKPTVTKALILGSDSSLDLPYLAVGEVATYRMVVTLPEGDSADLRVIDVLPAGLGYVVSSAVATIGSGVLVAGSATVATGSITVTDGAVTLDLGAIHSTGAANKVTLDLRGVIQDVDSVHPGDTLTNSATVTSGGSLIGSATAEATIAAPLLSLTYVPGGYSGDAGMTVPYHVQIVNNGNAAAYNVTAHDVVPGDILVSSLLASAGSVAVLNTGTIAWTDGTLAAGATIDLTFTGTFKDSVQPGATLTSTATIDRYATQVSNGNTLTTGPASVTETVILAPSISMALKSVSDAALGTSSNAIANGETLTYAVMVTPGHGTQSLKVGDVLPSGLTFVSATVVSAGGMSGVATGAISPSAGVYNLGTNVVNAASNNGTIELDITAVVTNTATLGAAVVNTATITSTAVGSSAGSAAATSNAITETVVVPNLTLSYVSDVASGQAGTPVSYHAQIVNNGNAAAYNVTAHDVVPGDILVSGLGASGGSAAVLNNGTIAWTDGTLAAGATIDLTFTGTFKDTVQPGAVLTSTATIDAYATQVSNGKTLSVSTQSVTETVILAPSISMTLKSVSDAALGTSSTHITNGETLTYAVMITPGHGTQSLKVADLLPSGLTFVSATVASAGGMSGIATGAISPSANVYNLGTNVVNAAANTGVIELDIVAVVTNSPAVGSAIVNTATITSAAVGGSAGSAAVTSNGLTETVVGPQLAITQTNVGGPGQAGQTVLYDIHVVNTGGSSAYTVAIADVLPADMTVSNIRTTGTISGGGTINGGTALLNGGTISWTDGTIVAGGTVDLLFTGTYANTVQQGETLTNTATVSSYKSQPGNSYSPAGIPGPSSKTNAVVLSPSISMAFLSGSLTLHQGEIANGESLTYALYIVPGYGTQNLTVTSLLPAGLSYKSARVANLGGMTGVNLQVVSAGTYSLGTVVNPVGNTGTLELDITYLVSPSNITGAQIDTSASVTAAPLTGVASPAIANSGTVTETVIGLSISESLKQDTGVSDTDNFTSKSSVTGVVTGASLGAGGTTVVLKELVNGQLRTVAGTMTYPTASTWQFVPSISLADGIHNFIVSLSSSPTTTANLTFTYATKPPVAPSVLQLPLNKAVQSAAQRLSGLGCNDTTSSNVISGKGIVGSFVEVSDLVAGRLVVVGSTVVGASGTWSVTAAGLSQGIHHFVATQKDLADNKSAPGYYDIVYDTIAPQVTEIVTRSSGKIVQITGVGDPGALVTLSNGKATIGTTTAGANGSWKFLPPVSVASALGVQATEVDFAHNVGVAIAGSGISYTVLKGNTTSLLDTGTGTTLSVGVGISNVLLNLAADATAKLNLIGGSAQYGGLNGLNAALISDQHGGSLLSFGGGTIDFVGLAPGNAFFTASHITLS